MATNLRYTSAGGGSSGVDSNVSSVGNQNSSSSQTGLNYTATDASMVSDQTQTSNSTTKNMDSAAMAALQKLIAQLAAGGTPEMQKQAAQRDQVLLDTRAAAQGYSKPAAFADAQGLISQQMRRTLEALLPSINRASEDAGSSGGALRALLLQDAANKAAESSSAMGVQTATQYGNINANFAQVMEALTRQDPKATEMLLGALGVAKGATQTSQGTVRTVGSQNTSSNSTQQTSQNTNSNTNTSQNVRTDYAPFQVAVDTTPKFFGAMDTPVVSYAGSSAHNREQLSGLLDNSGGWSSYEF